MRMTGEHTSPNGHLLTPEQLEQAKVYIFQQLPKVLMQSPEFVTFVEGIVAEKFPRRDEFARLLDEVQAHRQETRQFAESVDKRFEQVDKRFDRVEGRLDSIEGALQEVHKSIDRLGARWGIRNEKVFRKTMRTLFEESFGVNVEERHIGGEQYDVVIHNGDHILIEITASVGPKMQERLVRKREKYIAATGVTPTRSILAVGSVSRKRGAALEALGFEVIEPDDDYEE